MFKCASYVVVTTKDATGYRIDHSRASEILLNIPAPSSHAKLPANTRRTIQLSPSFPSSGLLPKAASCKLDSRSTQLEFIFIVFIKFNTSFQSLAELSTHLPMSPCIVHPKFKLLTGKLPRISQVELGPSQFNFKPSIHGGIKPKAKRKNWITMLYQQIAHFKRPSVGRMEFLNSSQFSSIQFNKLPADLNKGRLRSSALLMEVRQ